MYNTRHSNSHHSPHQHHQQQHHHVSPSSSQPRSIFVGTTTHGDHWLLFIFRVLLVVLTILSFFLFFIGLGTETWFVVSNGALSFNLSPVYFCPSNADSCTSISWDSYPTPLCGVTTTEIEDRYRTVTGFTVLAGLCTLFVLVVLGLSYCYTSKRQKLMDVIAVFSTASFCFGFIAVALWGYTLQNYQYCGVKYCEHMSQRGLAQPTCSAELSHSFNSVVVACFFMLVCLILSVAHTMLWERLELEDPDAVANKMVPQKILAVIQEARNPSQPRATTRAYYNGTTTKRRTQRSSSTRGNGGTTNTRRRNYQDDYEQEQQSYDDEEQNNNTYYYEGRHGSRSPTTRQRQRQLQIEGRQQQRSSYSDQPSATMMHQSKRGHKNRFGPNTSSRNYNNRNNSYSHDPTTTNHHHDAYYDDEEEFRQQQQRNSRPKPDVWRPPRNSDYAREPETQLWWSASKPNEYIDGRTGHILDTNHNLWYDPAQNVWYEVEEDNGQQ